MKDYLKRLPLETQDLIRSCQEAARAGAQRAYLVGGFVRDLLLGVPNFDLDIVIEGDGIKYAQGLASCLNGKLTRHKRFGTATLWLKPHLKIDISSSRRETYPCGGHLPQVSPGSLKDDLFRRDFTINAMAVSIAEDDFGRLVDLFGGASDLRRKKIRILHEQSFVDDPTRLLRAVRFEQRYGFKIEPVTLHCLKSAVREGLLEKVEPQRLRDDLVLVLKEKYPLREIRRLKVLSGFHFISPQVSVSSKTLSLLVSVHRQILWFERNHHQRRGLEAWLIYFMGILDGLDAPAVKEICRRFAFRKGEGKRIESLKKMNRRSLGALCQKNASASSVFEFFEPLSYEAILFLKAKYKNRFFQKHVERFLQDYNHVRIHVNGDDLRACGILPGPAYRRILRHVLKARLNGRVRTKEQELQLARALACKSKQMREERKTLTGLI